MAKVSALGAVLGLLLSTASGAQLPAGNDYRLGRIPGSTGQAIPGGTPIFSRGAVWAEHLSSGSMTRTTAVFGIGVKRNPCWVPVEYSEPPFMALDLCSHPGLDLERASCADPVKSETPRVIGSDTWDIYIGHYRTGIPLHALLGPESLFGGGPMFTWTGAPGCDPQNPPDADELWWPTQYNAYNEALSPPQPPPGFQCQFHPYVTWGELGDGWCTGNAEYRPDEPRFMSFAPNYPSSEGTIVSADCKVEPCLELCELGACSEVTAAETCGFGPGLALVMGVLAWRRRSA